MHDSWISWIYFYAVGGTLLLASLAVILRTDAARWSLPSDRRLIAVLLGGTVASATIHAAWIFWAID